MTTETRSTCPYCGVGCGVIIQAEGAQITGVRGDPDHPANFGRLCTKGSTLHLTASAEVTLQTRLLRPMQRLVRGAAPQAIGWDQALDQAADKFSQVIRDHGPDAVGFYLSGQLLTEDYYVFNKLAKGLLGTNNLDTNSRLCMSSAVAGYKQTLGADAPPACYDDVNHTDCLFIVGSNTAWAHPILFRRIEDAKRANPAMKIIVVDPRRTDTCEIADLHLAVQPGTDVMLFHGMLHLMLWEGWTQPAYIAAHTSGFDALKATVRDCTPEKVAQVCGITQADLLQAARLFATSQATLSLYCMGMNQSSSGTAKNAALINLHLATAQIGKPGAGPFSLTGQPNAMGGREVGGLSNLLPGHRDMANAAHRAEVAAFWGVDSVPAVPGKSAIEMFQAAADGEIKALWIACTNPAQSMPDQVMVRRALERAEFVVVQEAFAGTATCAFADLLLPATSWGEKEGTVTNSERRISRVRPAVAAPGETRHDWSIAVDFARRLEARGIGFAPLPPRGEGGGEGQAAPTLFPYANAESVWNEHRATTRGRDLDITGLSWPLLDAQGPQQWPLAEGQSTGRARLYEDGVFPTADGRARFADAPYKPVAEAREARYPFSLNTGRLRDQWHGMSRTGTLGRLFGHVPEPVVQMHAQDMERRQLKEGDLVHVTSRRGSIVVPVAASAELGLSQAFIAMHWGPEYLGGRSSVGEPLAGVNALTTPAYCPISKQPELKHTPVKILKAELPWSLLAMAWLPAESALSARTQLRALAEALPFVSCVPFGANAALDGGGAQRTGVLLRAAAHDKPDDALLVQIEVLLGLTGMDTLRYADARRGQRRAVRLVRTGADAHVEGVLLAGDTRAESWIKSLLQDQLPAQAFGRQLLSFQPLAPSGITARGKLICSCFGISETAIQGQLAQCSGSDDERLAALQGALKCGTNCGSCIPELKRMVRGTAVAA
ncbi:nitrate reductase [Pseudorhodoferax sp. Leaf267]|uniref:nitrate reductase n=1 Tax=Pseudorhodoferax sp. Leaf267 TaxID=1736316 RepID=UPI0006FFC4E0|nr:nitrate reductase [Pseudorhodoferax sp. Leaf267]KQP22168.1 nitrate reductase [Pseudorhodoferax sp. Leaf267]